MSNVERQTLREWRKKDNKALFTIYQGLDEATLEMVAPAKTSKEVWEMLNKTYSGVEKKKKKYGCKHWEETLRSWVKKVMRQFQITSQK